MKSLAELGLLEAAKLIGRDHLRTCMTMSCWECLLEKVDCWKKLDDKTIFQMIIKAMEKDEKHQGTDNSS